MDRDALMAASFIHLRAHSAYSLLEGAILAGKLPNLAKDHAMPAVAMTDTGNLFGALEFSYASVASGIQPIIGCILGVKREDPERGGYGQSHAGEAPEPLLLLAQNEVGYRNLVQLVSKSFMDTTGNEPPQVTSAMVGTHAEGLICLTGVPASTLGRLVVAGRMDAAAELLDELAEVFPGRLYIELQRHGLTAEDRIEPMLVELAYARDLPLVATNDVYFDQPDFYEAHDALLCIAAGTTINASDRRRLTTDHCFKSAADMRLLFADLPEACDNTIAIAERCSFVLLKQQPILPPFTDGSGRSEDELLDAMSRRELDVRLERQVLPKLSTDQDPAAVRATYFERLEYELGVIRRMGYSGYYLIVADFIRWAKDQRIPVGPGRGSGAGSVVAWACTITDVDPIELNLLFERFLNPERVSMPDFDVDFCQDRRGEVLDYVQRKYGRDRVAQIITFGKLQARAVLRDVGRVLAMPYGQVDRICKLVPNNPAAPVTLAQAIAADEQLRALRDGDESVARLMELAMKLEGLFRHASTHAAGVVIADRPLTDLVPLYRDPKSEMPVTQFNMKYVEDAGLVKFDFLGLKTLTVVEHAVKLVNEKPDCSIDLLTLPLDDAKSYEMLARGDTMGVFQFEGAGMRDLHRKLKPTNFEDLIAIVSLFRPGPMDSIPEYIATKHGHQAPDYMHPSLEPILSETYGVMTYQEQVMQIAQVLAGYSLGGADLLRRAMGKKKKSEMDAQRKTFLAGAEANGVSASLGAVIFDKMAKFAGYGFNKCHAAPYALVAYQTAYLKANHPVEFMAASMTLDLGNTDKLNLFRQELQRLKIQLLPVDINRSGVGFTVEDGAVRYALAAVKGVGKEAMKSLVGERDRGGAYRDLFDLAGRLDARQFNKRQFENLAKAGAFDGFDRNRAQSFAAADILMRHAAATAEQRESNQISLFGGPSSAELDVPKLPKTPDWQSIDRLQYEFDAIGFHLSAHPLDPYINSFKRLGIVPSAHIRQHLTPGGPGRIRLAGIVVGRKERTSARGNRFAFIQMSDLSGLFEVTAFSEILAASRTLLDSGVPILLSAEVRVEGEDGLRIMAQGFEPLDQAATAIIAGWRITLSDLSALPRLRSALDETASTGKLGGSRVRLVVPASGHRAEIALPDVYQLSGAVRSALATIPGVAELQDF